MNVENNGSAKVEPKRKSRQGKQRKLSKIMKEKWRNDEEYKQHMSEVSRKRMNDRWANPVERARMLRHIRKTRKDSEYKEKMSIIMKRVATDKFKRNLSEVMKEKYSSEDYRELFSEIASEHKEEHSKRMKSKWEDPTFVFRVMYARTGSFERALDNVERRFGKKVRAEYEKKGIELLASDS